MLAKEDGKALILSKDSIGRKAFGSTCAWKDSTLRTYLNGEWLESTTLLKEKAVQTDITTRIWNTSDFDTTQDKVFLLSEADLFGTYNYGKEDTDSKDYTYNGQVIVPNIEIRSSNDTVWLRSPAGATLAAMCGGTGTINSNNVAHDHGVRPALWIKLP